VAKARALWGFSRTVVLWNSDPKRFLQARRGRGSFCWFRARPMRGGDLVLMHDNIPHSIDALPVLVEEARRAGAGLRDPSDWIDRGSTRRRDGTKDDRATRNPLFWERLVRRETGPRATRSHAGWPGVTASTISSARDCVPPRARGATSRRSSRRSADSYAGRALSRRGLRVRTLLQVPLHRFGLVRRLNRALILATIRT